MSEGPAIPDAAISLFGDAGLPADEIARAPARTRAGLAAIQSLLLSGNGVDGALRWLETAPAGDVSPVERLRGMTDDGVRHVLAAAYGRIAA